MDTDVLEFQKRIVELSQTVASPSVTEADLARAKDRLALEVDLFAAKVLANGICGPEAEGVLNLSWRLGKERRESKTIELLQQLVDSNLQIASGVVDDL